MMKHTTLNLDMALVQEAKMALGTTQINETVHRALEQAVMAKRRAWLAAAELPDLTAEALEEMRRPRAFGGETGTR